MTSLRGALCAELPPFVVDKYFDVDTNKEPLKAMAAFAICGHCPVKDECREEAISHPVPPKRGVIGGVAASQINTARSWRRYELGITDTPPKQLRPYWLTMPDAAHNVEANRLSADPDEPEFPHEI